MKLNELKGNTKLELLQVGESGDGKTKRALTATVFGPVFLIDTDNKIDGFVSQLPEAQSKLIEVRQCKNVKEVVAALNELIKDSAKYATLIFDTWSSWHDMLINDFVEKNKAKRHITKGYDDQDIQTLAEGDWGSIKKSNERFLYQLRSIPVNLIVNTHIGMKQMEDGSTKLTVGDSGSFGRNMPKAFNEVHHLYVNTEGKYKVKGKRGSKITAKSLLPDSLFDEQGNFKVEDLSVFKGIAKEVK